MASAAAMRAGQRPGDPMIAVMGATGTGKSTFIKLLTNDNNVVIGHRSESETNSITLSRYFDTDAGRSVFLIDTPGFDDSRDGVTDTDTLEKIVEFLLPPGGPEIKLNGIVYMHRISDPRLGGVARKNLRMFRQLCGDTKLGNVRIVTTNWSRVSAKEGTDREADLANSNTAFKPLLDAGAVLRRQDGTAQTARSILSELVSKKPVTMQIQEELEGRTLGATSAGAIITEDIERLQKKHEKEMASLKKEMEEAAKATDEALRAELAEERRVLEEKMARTGEDRTRLERTPDRARARLQEETKQTHEMQKQAQEEAARLERRIREQKASRGVVTRYFGEFDDIVGGCARMGMKELASVGQVGGAIVGVCIAPLVAGWRTIFGA